MNLIELFVNDGFDEMLVVVGGQPRAKKLGRWIVFKNQNMMLSDWGKLIQSLLTDKQKSDLDVLGTTSGQIIQKNNCFQYHFFQKSDLFKFHVVRQELSSVEIQLPQRGIDFLKKSNGLNLFIGTKDSKINLLIDQSLKSISQDQLQNFLVLNPEGIGGVGGMSDNYTVMNYNESDVLKDEKLYHGFDCIVFIEPEESLLRVILNLLDNGVKIILSMHARTVIHSIQKILSYFSNDRNSQLRFIAQIDAIFYQMKYGHDCYIHELVFLNDQIRQLIHEQNWTEFDQFLSQTSDHPNLMTLNQSLIQLILKRKIDLRKAFELTRYPGQLDLMLKKVGV